jgi:hypothetical protein
MTALVIPFLRRQQGLEELAQRCKTHPSNVFISDCSAVVTVNTRAHCPFSLLCTQPTEHTQLDSQTELSVNSKSRSER